MNDKQRSKGWGVKTDSGAEIWDAKPVFLGETIPWKDWAKLLFYPKRFLLYRHIRKHVHSLERRFSRIDGAERYVPTIVDVGCGTGAHVIDLKKMFGRRVNVIGLDVVQLQIDLAKVKLKQHGVWAEVLFYDGVRLPLNTHSVDALYTSDVLGHVADVPAWLGELARVLKPGGVLAIFSESKLGKHAYLRNYLLKRGMNTDPHAEFHISLFSKEKLAGMLDKAGFDVGRMYTTAVLKFLIHPDELYPAFQASNQFPMLKALNWLLYFLKKKTHPYSTALCELYSLVEMLTIGRFLESQGYVVLARKKRRTS